MMSIILFIKIEHYLTTGVAECASYNTLWLNSELWLAQACIGVTGVVDKFIINQNFYHALGRKKTQSHNCITITGSVNDSKL